MKAVTMLTLFLTLVAAPLSAHSTEVSQYGPAELVTLAEDHVKALIARESSDDRIEVSAGSLDPRMGIRTCQQPIDVNLANNATLDRQTTVLIQCHDYEGWRLFIPVRIQQMRAIVVAARQLSPGDVIGRSDVKFNHVDIHQLRDSAHTNIDELLGAQIKRRIGINQAIQARHTCFVCRGQNVTIISGSNGLEVRATGVARNDGLMGDRITVRNSRSNRDVQAVVSGSNEVRVVF